MSARHLTKQAKTADDLPASVNLDDRMIEHAEFIIEKIFHRQRWIAADRDRLADKLALIVRDELLRERKKHEQMEAKAKKEPAPEPPQGDE